MAAQREMMDEVRAVRAIMERAQRWSVSHLQAPFYLLWGAVLLGGGIGEVVAPPDVQGLAWSALTGAGALASVIIGALLGPRARVREALWWRHPLHWGLVLAAALGLPHLLGLGWSVEGTLLLGLVLALGYVLYGLWWFPVAAVVGALVGAVASVIYLVSPEHTAAASALAWAAALLGSGLLVGRRWGWR